MVNSYKEIINSRKQQSAFDELTNSVEEAVENGYVAYKTGRNSKPEVMLEINLKGGKSFLFYYFEIKTILFDGDGSISIIRPHEIIHISGANLYGLKDYFRDNRIQVLHQFDPAKHQSVVKSDQPFIEEIEVSGVGDAEERY